jgi:hypothetical protein
MGCGNFSKTRWSGFSKIVIEVVGFSFLIKNFKTIEFLFYFRKSLK